jgi:hypothetical protein
MPFVFIVLGLLLLIVAFNGTQGALVALLKSEFTGPGSFVPFAAAIMILGAVGYIKPAKPIADGMIGLVILAMILGNKGRFFSAINTGLSNPVAPSVAATGGGASSSSMIGSANAATPSSTGSGAATGANLLPVYNQQGVNVGTVQQGYESLLPAGQTVGAPGGLVLGGDGSVDSGFFD